MEWAVNLRIRVALFAEGWNAVIAILRFIEKFEIYLKEATAVVDIDDEIFMVERKRKIFDEDFYWRKSIN